MHIHNYTCTCTTYVQGICIYVRVHVDVSQPNMYMYIYVCVFVRVCGTFSRQVSAAGTRQVFGVSSGDLMMIKSKPRTYTCSLAASLAGCARHTPRFVIRRVWWWCRRSVSRDVRAPVTRSRRLRRFHHTFPRRLPP